MKEDALVSSLLEAADAPRPASLLVGPGDDCAVVRTERGQAVLKTDCVIESVHFLPGTGPGKVGWKAAARVVSDLAAMGARPQHALVTLALNAAHSVQWARGVYRGIGRCARTYGFSLAGGETATTPSGSWLSVSMTGRAPRRPVLRSGGRIGDLLFVTGTLGGSLRADRHLTFEPRLEEGCWLAKQRGVHAMMDLSDGLAADLPRLARASDCGWDIDPESLPRRRGATISAAMNDGEDYELLVAVEPKAAPELESAWTERFELKLTRIGRLMPADQEHGLEGDGYDHCLQR